MTTMMLATCTCTQMATQTSQLTPHQQVKKLQQQQHKQQPQPIPGGSKTFPVPPHRGTRICPKAVSLYSPYRKYVTVVE